MGRASRRKWWEPGAVRPDAKRETAQEFLGNVADLGKYARTRYMDECKKGLRVFDQKELDELDANIAIVEAERAKVQ